ncbi:MAG TPA: hypothetical protein VFW59_10395, partial [Gallionella sp.]|nr:hypothetical protein [Gallionella sp.]
RLRRKTDRKAAKKRTSQPSVARWMIRFKQIFFKPSPDLRRFRCGHLFKKDQHEMSRLPQHQSAYD